MPIIGLMRWDTGSDRAHMEEHDLTIVPRMGDLLQVRMDSDGRVAVFRVFAVVIHSAPEELVADVHAEQVSGVGTAAGAYIASLRRR
jgi:hypothetical protein